MTHDELSKAMYDCFHSLSQPSMQGCSFGAMKNYVQEHVNIELARLFPDQTVISIRAPDCKTTHTSECRVRIQTVPGGSQ